MIYTPSFEAGHYGHNSVDYAEVLEKGFWKIKEEADRKLAICQGQRAESRLFLESVILCLDAAAKAGARFAAKAREVAARRLTKREERIDRHRRHLRTRARQSGPEFP